MAREKPTMESLSQCAEEDIPCIPMLYANEQVPGHDNRFLPDAHVEMAQLSFASLMENTEVEVFEHNSPMRLLLEGIFSSGWVLALRRAADLLGVDADQFVDLVDEAEGYSPEEMADEIANLLKKGN